MPLVSFKGFKVYSNKKVNSNEGEANQKVLELPAVPAVNNSASLA